MLSILRQIMAPRGIMTGYIQLEGSEIERPFTRVGTARECAQYVRDMLDDEVVRLSDGVVKLNLLSTTSDSSQASDQFVQEFKAEAIRLTDRGVTYTPAPAVARATLRAEKASNANKLVAATTALAATTLTFIAPVARVAGAAAVGAALATPVGIAGACAVIGAIVLLWGAYRIYLHYHEKKASKRSQASIPWMFVLLFIPQPLELLRD